MNQQRSLQLPSWWEISNERSQIRWNRHLSKAFDVTSEEFPAASAEEALVSKYLGVAIKHLERRSTQIPSVRMGAFLTAVERELAGFGRAKGWTVDDVRNLDHKGEETPPVYEVIQLNSTQDSDFLVDGMRFLRQGDDVRATLRVQPRWWGLQVTAYGLRTAGTAAGLLTRIHGLSKDINFLKGEAFSLSGEFLPKTTETFSDLFLEPGNAAAIERVVKLINQKGKSLENRGVLLMGPPGTGKTLSARIVRNEAKATFIWVSARDFYYSGSFGGFTEAFDLARECAPSVVVFEDVDNWLYGSTVDLLKTEMDGVARSSGVVTMMTTNYPELLPAALIDRPGRFHDVLKFDLPDESARKQMLLRWLPDAPVADVAAAVKATDGYSGAHIRELARFAQIIAEQDGLTIGKALLAALQKLAEQRDLITATQRGQSYYRGVPGELVKTAGVRLTRELVGTKTFEQRYKAWAGLVVKGLDEERRIISGIASTPTPDRVGDIIEPLGAEFEEELSLLLFHDHEKPIGTVRFQKPTKTGVPFVATLPRIEEMGTLRDRVEEAWQSIKAGLLRKVSIGFRPLEGAVERIKDTGGLRFLKTEFLELSLVAVPANPEAAILTVKSAPSVASDTTASGHGPAARTKPAGVSASVTGRSMKKTIAEQIQSFEATRREKSERMQEIQSKAGDEGRSKDAAEKEEFDTLKAEVKQIDSEIEDLREMDELNKATATVVKGTTPDDANRSRGGGSNGHVGYVHVRENVEPGIQFARMVLCKAASFLSQGTVSPLDVAKHRHPDDRRIHEYLMKVNQPAGSTLDATWAGNLVDPTNLASEFIEYLRPQTVIGKFGTNGIPSLRRVPFNIRVTSQTTGGNAWWVGQGAPKPVTGFGTGATTLLWAKIAAISVITEELARFSSPSAETMVRDGLRDAIVQQLDNDFVDPAKAADANVSPASITNLITPLTPSGTSADNARTDLGNLLEQFILNNINPANVVLIMPNTVAMALSLMRNSLGQKEFPDLTMNGGRLEGLPVITSQHAANASGSGNMVIAVNASDIFLADDGQVNIDVSREASLQMLDNPTVNSVTPTAVSVVSLWQTNSIGLRAERFINWARRRTQAVSFLDDVNWGSIGSPS